MYQQGMCINILVSDFIYFRSKSIFQNNWITFIWLFQIICAEEGGTREDRADKDQLNGASTSQQSQQIAAIDGSEDGSRSRARSRKNTQQKGENQKHWLILDLKHIRNTHLLTDLEILLKHLTIKHHKFTQLKRVLRI